MQPAAPNAICGAQLFQPERSERTVRSVPNCYNPAIMQQSDLKKLKVLAGLFVVFVALVAFVLLSPR